MEQFTKHDLLEWCKIPMTGLLTHPERKVNFRICKDSQAMGLLMARELVDEIKFHNQRDENTRAIIPCGPVCWYRPFTDLVNSENVSLKRLVVFHMDDDLDWQGQPLPHNHPCNFRTYMEENFYKPVRVELQVPDAQRRWLEVATMEQIRSSIAEQPVDISYGGWGQDGHLAYNQARRNPYSTITLEELRNSSIRLQENNLDTVIAVSQRQFGMAYQFMPPMSITLGLKEILAAKKVRVFSDTGAWKQTALRVALFGPLTTEYPITFLQEHPDALITATEATATHPFAEHPEWDFGY